MTQLPDEEFLEVSTDTPINPSYLQLANVVMRWHDKVLLIHRNTEPMKGYWSVPGGGIEPGESAETAARRELVEEVGVAGVDLKLLYVFVTHEHKMESRIFIATSPDGKVSNPEPDEQDSASWLTIKEALEHKLTPGVRQFLISLDASE